MKSRVFLTVRVVIFISIFALSCKKKELRDQQKELKIMKGTWSVDKREVLVFDTLGNLLSTTTSENLGNMEFVLSQDYDKSSSLAFNTIKFKPVAFPVVFDYFSSKAAGDFDGDNFFCQWEVDPDKSRLLFWAIGPSSKWHLTCDLEMEKKRQEKQSATFCF